MKNYWTLLLITGAAFFYRLVLLLLLGNEIVVENDQVNNIILGGNFAAGNFFGILDTYWTPVYPFLIGLIALFVDSIVLPAIIVSLIGGTLIVSLTYVLVGSSYGEQYGIIAGILALFYPHLINSMFELQSENIYAVFMIAALITGWKGMKFGSLWLYFATGILIGLAYLTRPEAFGYLLFFILFALVKDVWEGRGFSKRSFAMVGVLILGFLILAAPYIYYLKVETGQWTISGKLIANVAGGDLRVDAGEGYAARSMLVTEKVESLLVTVFYNLVGTQDVLASLLPFLVLILFSLGMLGVKWDDERIRRELYLIGFCAVTVATYTITVLQARYFYVLFPIFFGWIAIGAVLLARWFAESFRNWIPDRGRWLFETRPFAIGVLVFLFLYTLPILSFVKPTESKWASAAYEERDAGLWLQENSKPGPVIFSASRRPVFYAKGKHVFPVTRDPERNFDDIIEKGAEYVILGDRSLTRNEFLSGMDRRLEEDGRFEQVYNREDFPGYGIKIYKRRE